MTFSEVSSLITGRLGNRSGQEGGVLNELRAAQVKLEGASELPWFLREVKTIPISNPYPLPTKFIKLASNDSVMWQNYETRVYIMSQDRLAAYGCYGDAVGFPMAYSQGQDGFTLYPRPLVGNLIIDAFIGDVVIDPEPTFTNKWLIEFPLLLAAMAGMEMAKFLRDPEAVQNFGNSMQEEYSSYMRKLVAKEEEGRTRIKE